MCIRDRIYAVSLEGATDVSTLESLQGASFVPVKKALLLDLADAGIPLEHFEGMSFGPSLPDGRSTLVLVSDDNFNPAQNPTTFLVFAIERGPMTIARIQGARHRSPLEGSWVFGVPGVVTAIDRDTRREVTRCQPAKLRFMGLFDTVLSTDLPFAADYRLAIPDEFAYVAHAVALNEYRSQPIGWDAGGYPFNAAFWDETRRNLDEKLHLSLIHISEPTRPY